MTHVHETSPADKAGNNALGWKGKGFSSCLEAAFYWHLVEGK